MPAGLKVCVVGGAGGIGQPLALLTAMDPNVAELNVIDLTISMVPADGVRADLSHLNHKCKVTSYSIELGQKPVELLGECYTGSNLVIVPAGMPRKPGQDRKDLLAVNAGIAKQTVEACCKFCPDAVIALIVNPVNSVVPAMGALWKKKTGKEPTNIVGVTTLDCVRAAKFVYEVAGGDISKIDVPVIGGHAGTTILPLFSQDPVAKTISEDKIKGDDGLDKRTQDAGTEVVKAKNGKGSATLSMAYAGARFAKAILSGLAGEPMTECSYVASDIVPGLPYFASKVTFGPKGVQTVHGIGELNAYEKERLEALKPILKEEIDAGLEYAATVDFEG
jgi:malate dehydrogenase